MLHRWAQVAGKVRRHYDAETTHSTREAYTFVPMSRTHLRAMDTWTYGPYFPDFDTQAYHDSADSGAEPMTGPAGCHGYAVLAPDGELVGLFEYYFAGDGSASIGLALKPELTGQGRGAGFLEAGIEFLVTRYRYGQPYVYLDVAPTNAPALTLYTRAGFEPVEPRDHLGEDVRMRRRLTAPSRPSS